MAAARGALGLEEHDLVHQVTLQSHRVLLFRFLDNDADEDNAAEKHTRWASAVQSSDGTLAEFVEASFPARLDSDLCQLLIDGHPLDADGSEVGSQQFTGANATADREAYTAACHSWQHRYAAWDHNEYLAEHSDYLADREPEWDHEAYSSEQDAEPAAADVGAEEGQGDSGDTVNQEAIDSFG